MVDDEEGCCGGGESIRERRICRRVEQWMAMWVIALQRFLAQQWLFFEEKMDCVLCETIYKEFPKTAFGDE